MEKKEEGKQASLPLIRIAKERDKKSSFGHALWQEQKTASDESSQTPDQLEAEKARRAELESELENVQAQMQSQLEAIQVERAEMESRLASVQAELENRLETEKAHRAEAEAQRANVDSYLEELKAKIHDQRSETESSIQTLNEQASTSAKKLADLVRRPFKCRAKIQSTTK